MALDVAWTKSSSAFGTRPASFPEQKTWKVKTERAEGGGKMEDFSKACAVSHVSLAGHNMTVEGAVNSVDSQVHGI